MQNIAADAIASSSSSLCALASQSITGHWPVYAAVVLFMAWVLYSICYCYAMLDIMPRLTGILFLLVQTFCHAIALLVMLTVSTGQYPGTCDACDVLLCLAHDSINPLDQWIQVVMPSVLLGYCSSHWLSTPALAGCQMVSL
jgi:hypothetical protein